MVDSKRKEYQLLEDCYFHKKNETFQLFEEFFIDNCKMKELITFIKCEMHSNLKLVLDLDRQVNINKYNEAYMNYQNILIETKRLAQEFKLNSTLEYANLFSFLLWNGYFSNDKNLSYNSNNRYMIEGLFGLDVTQGIGVCLNFSDMLKDFLQISNINAINLTNKMGYKIYPERVLEVERKISSSKRRKSRLHLFTLIEENNKYYIYDPTNLVIFEVINPFKANLVTGFGKSSINVFNSFLGLDSENEINELNKFIHSKNFELPFSKEEILDISNYNEILFKNNLDIFNDFYSLIEPNIVGVVDSVKRVRTK